MLVEHAAEIQRADQTPIARLYQLGVTWATGGEHTVELEDLYTGLARHGLEKMRLDADVLAGVEQAAKMGHLGTEHLELLVQVEPRVTRWLQQRMPAPEHKHRRKRSTGGKDG